MGSSFMFNFKTRTNQKISTNKALALILSISLIALYLPAGLAADSDLNFKVYSPETPPDASGTSNEMTTSDNPPVQPGGVNPDEIFNEPLTTSSKSEPAQSREPANSPALSNEMPVSDLNSTNPSTTTTTKESEAVNPAAPQANNNPGNTSHPETEQAVSQTTDETTSGDNANSKEGNGKVLKGYVCVVPSGTKIPIIMDTAVDSDTSQEGDEFSARTAEDLTIDGNTVVPAGSIIRGRIAALNAPKHMDRSGSVALKFDTVTTPDNRQIPLVANLVARGGVVHARRGLKDVAMDTGIAMLPAAVGIGIGAVAGNSGNSKIGVGGGALIGAGIGAAVGVAILLAKKGKKVDVRPGDELKIELAEDLHMPTM